MLLVGTPGLKTTSFTWSSSHEGTSPASSLTTPSPLSASASFDQSMNPLRSFRTTSAPRAARNRDAATPLRPAPTTRTFLPSSSNFPQSSFNPSHDSQDGQDKNVQDRQDGNLGLEESAFLPASLLSCPSCSSSCPSCESAFRPAQRNFKVERLSSANRIAIIRKRKTIFGSFQPDISKWWCSGVILNSRRPVPVLRFVILKKETWSVTDSASIT